MKVPERDVALQEIILWGILGNLKRRRLISGDFFVSPVDAVESFLAFAEVFGPLMDAMIYWRRDQIDFSDDKLDDALVRLVKERRSVLVDENMFRRVACFNCLALGEVMKRPDQYLIRAWISIMDRNRPTGEGEIAQISLFDIVGDVNTVAQGILRELEGIDAEMKTIPHVGRASW